MNEFLWQEYALAYEIYEGYNQQLLTLKGWSVSIGFAALLAAYTTPVASSGRIGVLVAGLSAVPFWLTETLWKLFQRTSLDRIKQIEICQAGTAQSPDACDVAQLAGTWQSSFNTHKWAYWWEGAFDLHVIFPHVILLILGVGLAIFYPPKGDGSGT